MDREKEQVPFSGIFRAMPELREPPSFPEWFGATMASRLLWIICALVVAFLLGWWFTRPSIEEVKGITGAAQKSEVILETLRQLREDHFEAVRNLFQLLVLSGLIPLFTLLAGYAFGSRQGGLRGRDEEGL